jgi:hypothetical protein
VGCFPRLRWVHSPERVRFVSWFVACEDRFPWTRAGAPGATRGEDKALLNSVIVLFEPTDLVPNSHFATRAIEARP